LLRNTLVGVARRDVLTMDEKDNSLLSDSESLHVKSQKKCVWHKAIGGEMVKTLIVCIAILVLAGCERLPDSPFSPAPTATGQTLIISGFGDTDTVSVGNRGFRLAPYFDFSSYDSVSIKFSAQRLELASAVNHVLIKIGPACYISDSLAAPQKNISVVVRPSDIAKSQFAALSFIVPDAEASLFLSKLRVIGWTSR
jgi:hypothetical protein